MPDYFFFLLLLLLVGVNSVILVLVFLRGRGARSLQEHRFADLEKNQERIERTFKEEISRNREETGIHAQQSREELSRSVRISGESLLTRMSEIAQLQKNQLDTFANQLAHLTQSSEQKLERLRESLETKFQGLQEENSLKLEQMRATVDEKLHETLEKRLGESFKFVSERLEKVHQGLGEMQTLAAGVGDLKRVLTHVKTRGTWGEIQLGTILEELLTPDQFARNVATKKKGKERVEFAVKLPGKGEDAGHEVWLPLDAKFPREDYDRLLDARERADAAGVEDAAKQLEIRIKKSARDIREKYLDPPYTTDFAIMFLPTEGLYAEVLNRPGLFDTLQRKYRITVTGPTTLSALINSLQMGFRTLAIEKRSSEVWVLLGAVKTEFGKFGYILEKTQKKLQEASNTIEEAARKTRNIGRKLNRVQELPAAETVEQLGELEDEPEEAG
ncbi:MAG: DNA recombination protein RmuC [Deltaproteobacteria bacterium]|nr:DNA recombination protein RmuC [Deltaproteobacteria bacterium]